MGLIDGHRLSLGLKGRALASFTLADEHLARLTLAGIPGFAPEDIEAAQISRLPGLTNAVFKVELPGRTLCLRIPGPGTSAIIDRRAEEANARAAASVGIAPEVVFFAADGVMLTRYVEGAGVLSPRAFREREAAVERAGQALRRLHEDAPAFAGEFRAFAIMDRYIALLRRRKGFPSEAAALLERARAVRTALTSQPAPLRPCHCDPTGGNLLDTGARVVLIDWEYSGMNDPAWDLAYLSLEGEFDDAQESRFLAAYFGREPGASERARVVVMEAACDLLSALWALIQGSSGNRSMDFSAEAERRFRRCRRLMSSQDFAARLDVLGHGGRKSERISPSPW